MSKKGGEFEDPIVPSSVAKLLFRSPAHQKVAENWIEIFIAEVIGTAWLMFFGCMSLFGHVSEVRPSAPIQGSLGFGLIVSCVIVNTGHISKTHLNPSITLCFLLLGTITPLTSLVYFIAECIGALLGVYLLKVLTPMNLFSNYTANLDCGFCGTCLCHGLDPFQGFMLEFLATSILCWVVCSVMDPVNIHSGDTTGYIKFFFVVTLLSFIVGPFTGASMNPARSLAPAIINQNWRDHWIYWIAPLLGSLLTTIFYKFVFWPQTQKSALGMSALQSATTKLQKSVVEESRK